MERIKIIDDGGSGPYSAVAVTEDSLRDFVIYRPRQLDQSVSKAGRLPVVIFANGGCNDTSLPYERMLSEIASHAYIVIALGEMQDTLDDRPLEKAPNAMLIEGLDWISSQTRSKSSEYFATADLENVAFAGQSCGGAQILAVADEPRVDTFLMFNSGMGDMTMAGASKASLKNVLAPVIYLVGGQSDVATLNARLDFERIDHVPVAFASLPDGGHSGTYEEIYGGTFARLALAWLDWQLKDRSANAAIFVDKNEVSFPDWLIETRNFTEIQNQ